MTAKASLLAEMRRGASQAFVLHAIGVAVLFLMHTVVARLLGPADFGIFSYVLNLAGLLTLVVPLGWPAALMRLVAQYVEVQHWGLLRGALSQSHRITLAAAALVGLALLLASFLPVLSADLVVSLRFTALLLPVVCFVPLRRKALQALQRVPSSIAFEEIVLPLFAIALSVALAVANAAQALWAYFAATCLVLVLASAWLWRAFPPQARGVKPAYETRKWMAVALPIMIGNVAQMLVNRAGLLILGAMADMEAVGLFSAATRLANLNVFVLGAVNTIAAPMLAAAFHGGRPEQFRLLMRKAMLWSVLGSLPLFVFMMIWPEWLLHFFGPKFTDAAALLRILALGQFIHAATGPVGFGLIMSDQEVPFAVSTTVVAVLCILGSVVLIPLYGGMGAALVAAGGVALLSGWQYVLSRRIANRAAH